MNTLTELWRRVIAATIALISMTALAGCNTAHVASDYDHGAPFASYHRFTLIERPHPAAQNPIAVQRTYDAIRTELMSKGFVYVPDPAQADFAVDFTIGVSDRLDVHSYPATFGGWVGPGFGPGWWGDQVDVRQYHEGSLAIDVFDLRPPRPDWHGTAEKSLSLSEIEHSQAPIQEAVTAVLANFPPKPASSAQ